MCPDWSWGVCFLLDTFLSVAVFIFPAVLGKTLLLCRLWKARQGPAWVRRDCQGLTPSLCPSWCVVPSPGVRDSCCAGSLSIYSRITFVPRASVWQSKSGSFLSSPWHNTLVVIRIFFCLCFFFAGVFLQVTCGEKTRPCISKKVKLTNKNR